MLHQFPGLNEIGGMKRVNLFVFYIGNEMPKRAFIEIIQVMLPGIGFFFKGDMAICLIAVSIPDHQNGKFQDIPNIKQNNTGFQLLTKVDFFVIDKHGIVFQLRMFNNNKGKKCHGFREAERE